MQVEALEARRLFAANLLLDAAGISAAQSVTIGDTAYFFADNGTTGRELWKSDGTPAGTVLVKDLTPGAGSTQVVSFFHAGDRAIFLTLAGSVYSLWSTDGTAGATIKLADFTTPAATLGIKQVGEQVAIETYRASSFGGDGNYDGLLYFTDGTVNGTRLVKAFLATKTGDTIDSIGISPLYAAGNRVVFTINDEQIWSSDGTNVGTIELTSKILGSRHAMSFTDALGIAEAGGVVMIPDSEGSRVWSTDGTLAGTVAHNLPTAGSIGFSVVAGDKYYVSVSDNTQTPSRRTPYAIDLAGGGGAPVAIYQPPGDASDNYMSWVRTMAGVGVPALTGTSGRLFFHREYHDESNDTFTSTLMVTDGTPEGTTELLSFPNLTMIMDRVFIGDTAYFAVGYGGYQPGREASETGFVGWIGEREGDNVGNIYQRNIDETMHLELWKSDGTPDGTQKIRTLWEGPANGTRALATLTTVNGKLLVRTDVSTGITLASDPDKDVGLTTLIDDTSAYDPQELNPQRQGATARLVNGVLHINGSLNDDRIRLWRSQRMTDRLVVEYNGNERSFPFSSITKIVADLQDGNDYFQILEGEGQVIRTKTSILGGDGSDTIYGATGHDTIYGGNSGDLIYGRGNSDVILGGGGRDRINAGAGDDEVSGGSGVDSIVGGSGVDVYFGQTAVEKVFGEDVEGTQRDDDVFLD